MNWTVPTLTTDIKAWYRSAYGNPHGEWEPLPSGMADGRVIIRNSRSGQVLCPVHCDWEDYDAAGEFAVRCRSGRTTRGIIVPYFDGQESETQDEGNNGVLILPGSRWWKKKDEADQEAAEPQAPDKVPPSVFLYSLEVDTDECSCVLKSRSIDTEKLGSLKAGSLALTRVPEKQETNRFYFRGKHITSTGDGYYCPSPKQRMLYADVGKRRIQGSDADFFPACVSTELELVAERLVESYAGRKIRINKNYYRGYDILLALAHYPYEANCFELVSLLDFPGGDPENYMRRDNPDIYNEICRKLGIESFPTLRKTFEKNPRYLPLYKFIRELGFRDINIIMDILEAFTLTRWPHGRRGSKFGLNYSSSKSCFFDHI
ncbi:MAG: hypothetical protein IJL80_11620 [Treponema sp.]|nr:hypothetical protein [Treponema sp.]